MTNPLPRRPAAVVTGAASGMGRATASALVKDGWDVIALDRVAGEVAQRAGRVDPGDVGDQLQ